MAEPFEKGLKELSRHFHEADGMTIKAGILADATYPDTGESVAEIAMIQEYGAPAAGIPPRPFLWKALQDNGEDWVNLFRSLMVTAFYEHRASLDDVGTLVGNEMVIGIMRSIMSDMNPPNAPSTIKAKTRGDTGDPGTLRDTFVMVQAVEHEVVWEEE